MIKKPCKLPKGWRWVRLGEVLKTIECGKRPRGGVKHIKNGIPSLGAEHLTAEGGFNFNNIRFIPVEFFNNMRKGKIRLGDLLMVKDGATTGRVSIVDKNFPYTKAAVNEHIFILRPNSQICHSKYLFYVLRSPLSQHQIELSFHGAAQGGINQEIAEFLLIPLPSFNEQVKIVVKIEELLKRLQRIRILSTESINETNVLIQSCIDEIFSNIQPTGRFAEVITFKPRSGPSFLTNPNWNGIPVLMPSSVTGFGVDISKVEFGRGDEKINPKDFLQPGDILIARGNKPEQVGNAGVVPSEAKGWVCANLLMKLRVDEKKVDPYFCVYWLRTSYMRQYVKRNMIGSNPTIQKINQKIILNFPFPTNISLKRQKNIVSYLDELQAKITALKKHQEQTTAELNCLEQAILEKAFKGEL